MSSFVPNLDLAAFLWFVTVVGLFNLIAGHSSLEPRTIAGAIQKQRLNWMMNMAERDNRMLDGMVLQALSQGNAFFASTSAIGVGGLVSIIGSGDTALAFLQRLPYAAPATPLLWELKIVFLIVIFIYAFFKFAWAFRLSHYTGIMIGAAPIPNLTNQHECDLHAERTAKLIGIAAEHANSGLRSFYYAIAALGWFFHPLLFILITTWVIIILTRREFFSRANQVIAGRWP